MSDQRDSHDSKSCTRPPHPVAHLASLRCHSWSGDIKPHTSWLLVTRVQFLRHSAGCNSERMRQGSRTTRCNEISVLGQYSSPYKQAAGHSCTLVPPTPLILPTYIRTYQQWQLQSPDDGDTKPIGLSHQRTAGWQSRVYWTSYDCEAVRVTPGPQDRVQEYHALMDCVLSKRMAIDMTRSSCHAKRYFSAAEIDLVMRSCEVEWKVIRMLAVQRVQRSLPHYTLCIWP